MTRKIKTKEPIRRETAKARYENLNKPNNKESEIKHENMIDAKIKQAMAEGAFDNLSGKGKPLDLKQYESLPDHLRLGYHVLKSSGFIPEEVRLKKEMEELKEQMSICKSEVEKRKLIKQLNSITQQFNFCMEYNKKMKG